MYSNIAGGIVALSYTWVVHFVKFFLKKTCSGPDPEHHFVDIHVCSWYNWCIPFKTHLGRGPWLLLSPRLWPRPSVRVFRESMGTLVTCGRGVPYVILDSSHTRLRIRRSKNIN